MISNVPIARPQYSSIMLAHDLLYIPTDKGLILFKTITTLGFEYRHEKTRTPWELTEITTLVLLVYRNWRYIGTSAMSMGCMF